MLRDVRPTHDKLWLGPELPANWYMICASKDLVPGKVLSRALGAYKIVLYRGLETGTAICFSASCAHMGCSLAHATVKKDGLICALHHRLIKPDGSFAGMGPDREMRLQQSRFTTAEVLGCVFVYFGNGEVPPLAVPKAEGAGNLLYSYAGEQQFSLPWQVLVANGFDVEHLSAVHERQLQSEPSFQQQGRNVVLRYHTRPIGKGLSDHLTQRIARDGVFGTIHALSGSMMLVESVLGKRHSFILLSFCPDETGGTTIRGIVGAWQPRKTPLGSLSVWAAKKLFLAFLRKDLQILKELEWHEPQHAVTLGDTYTMALCTYFRGLDHAF